jgi:hypothetical protein
MFRVYDYTITPRLTESAERKIRMKKKIPKFNSEDEERDFWATHDSTEYVDWKKARLVEFPKLKPSTRTISIRLPESMLDDLKI